MKNVFERNFGDLIAEQVLNYQAMMTSKLEMHALPLLLIDDKLGRLNSELSKTHNSNPLLNEVYFVLYNKNLENKNLKMSELSEEYCLEKNIKYEEAKIFFPVLIALYSNRKWLSEIRSKLITIEDDNVEDQEEREAGEFTLNRRILAIELLVKLAGKEMNYGQMGVNKKKLAEFVDFLTSKELNSRDMTDTKVYKRLKANWGNRNRISKENLEFVIKQFENIGLINVVYEMENLLN